MWVDYFYPKNLTGFSLKKKCIHLDFFLIGLKFLNQSSQCESWLGSFAEFFPFKLEICAGFEFPRRRRHA